MQLKDHETVSVSDPYVKVNVAPVIDGAPSEFKTAAKDNTLAPVYGEIFETCCFSEHIEVGREEGSLTLSVFDDNVTSDEFMGNFSSKLGKVHCQCKWCY